MTILESPPVPEAAPNTKTIAGKVSGRRKSTLSKLMERATSDHSGNGGHIRRRRLKFMIDHTVCMPDMFDEDIEIVIEAPTAELELAAVKKYGAEPGAMILDMIRGCIVSVDGEPVRDSDLSRDALWEALGMTGRQLVAAKFNEVNGVSAEARKKADESTVLLVG